MDNSASEPAMQQQYTPLDFKKIKDFLLDTSSSEVVVCSLLQALGWRITKTKEASVRKEVIANYSEKDLLGLQEKEPNVIETLLNSKSRKIKEAAAKLIDILVLMYPGRVYLAKSDKLIILLINTLKQEKGDSVVWNHLLLVLQKFSMWKRFQVLMIEHDLIKWIVTSLRNEKDSLSDFSVEYLTALLMNLTLRLSAKKKCEALELEVLKVLDNLLEHENKQVRCFVNGALYSLMSSPILKKCAKDIKIDEHLIWLKESSDERMSNQINVVLEQLNKTDIEDSDEGTFYDEETDYQEDDDEFIDDDTDSNQSGPQVGEELLKNNFV